MALEMSTAGVTIGYAVEATKGTRPTTGYTAIPSVKSISDLNPEPNNLDCTPLEETEYKRYIPGLKDISGSVTLSANNTNDFQTKWAALVEAATTGAASEKTTWFEIKIPGLAKSFFFSGTPVALGLSEINVDEVLSVDAYITPNRIHGWDTKTT